MNEQYMNIIVGVARCSSDNKVRVSRYKIPGYNDAELKMLVIEPNYSEEISPTKHEICPNFGQISFFVYINKY